MTWRLLICPSDQEQTSQLKSLGPRKAAGNCVSKLRYREGGGCGVSLHGRVLNVGQGSGLCEIYQRSPNGGAKVNSRTL